MRYYYILFLLFISSSILFSQHFNIKHSDNELSLQQVERSPSGHIRCLHHELDAVARAKNPKMGTLEEFEKWLAPQVKKWKAQHPSSAVLPVLTIPVVFHILTDGTGSENLAADIVQAQIDQLNIDFRNLAGSNSPVAADIEIEFCPVELDPDNNLMPEPGINRITAYGGGPFSSTYIKNTIKPATIWNPNDYMNIWSADITGNTLGYAQFPDNAGLSGLSANGGDANKDGVVVGYGTIGAIAKPGNTPPFNMGRTLTHEIGHWLGLIHIWGDGGCAVDDFCNDTPLSDHSNFGCPNVTNCGSVDMVENYMDYTNDACMNLFTADQKARIRTVMSVCPRRKTLPNSTKCTAVGYYIATQDSIIAICPPADAIYTINIEGFGGYTDSVSLTVRGIPTGATATLANAVAAPNSATTLTLQGLDSVIAGTYNITIEANSTFGSKSLPLILIVSGPAPVTAVTLNTPSNQTLGASVPTNFNWTAAAAAGVVYNIEIATDATFTNIVEQQELMQTSYTSYLLSSNTQYFWRVSISNGCGVGPTSSTFQFTTASCGYYTNTNVPVELPVSGPVTTTSTLDVTAVGTVKDVNVARLIGRHSWVRDLTVKLTSPSGTVVTLFDKICLSEQDFDLKFDDDAATPNNNLPCPPTNGRFYQPKTTLSAFNGQSPTGTWTLTIIDNVNQDGGYLDDWALELCILPPARCSMTTSISTITHASCYDNEDGAFTILGENGTAPYVYDMGTGSQSSGAFTDLGAGTYITNVIDAAGCSASQMVAITEPTAISSSFTVTDVFCNGDSTGAVSAIASGGTPPYTYLWNTGANTSTITDLEVGNYYVAITDADGCIANAAATVAPTHTAAVLSTMVINPTANGTDGSIDLTLTGGTAPFIYTWSNGATTEDLSNLEAGDYTVVVTDAKGCTASTSVTLEQNTSLRHSNIINIFEVIPNPNLGRFSVQINLGQPQNASVKLVDVLGRQLHNWQFALDAQQQINIPVDINEQASGVYFLILQTENGQIETKRIIMNK